MVVITKKSPHSSLRVRKRKCSISYSKIASLGSLVAVVYIANNYYLRTYLKFLTEHGSKSKSKSDGSILESPGHFSGVSGTTKKPLAIVHVGQNLTADVAGALDYLEKDLIADGYASPTALDSPGFYTGSKSINNIIAYLKDDKTHATEITHKILNFKTFLSKNKEANKNIILSSNEFADLDPEVLSNLLSPDFDVRIVLVYRRFFDRIFTKYYTEHKNDKKPFETFVDYATLYEDIEDQSVGDIYRKFKETFDDIVVLESINGSHIFEQFFCETVITDAPKSCATVQDSFDGAVSTPDYGHSLEFKRLALVAQFQKILNQNVDMEEALNVLWSEEVDASTDSMPRKCMDSALKKKIKQIAIDEEALLFPEWGKEKVEHDFKAFEDNLCQLQTESILKDEHWLDIFKNINGGPPEETDTKPEEDDLLDGLTETDLETEAKTDVQSEPESDTESKPDSDAQSKPTLKAVIHVGPHFTGGSYIQEELLKLKDQLNFDSFDIPGDSDVPGFYLGPKASANLALFLEKKEGFATEETLPKFKEFLVRSKESNKNVILSSEQFAEGNPETLKPIFEDYSTRIVIVYKRFYEWLEDVHYEWFHAKNEPYEAFVPWMKTNFNWKIMSVSSISSKFKETFDDVQIIPFDDKESLVTRFFCDGVPEAQNTCAHIKGSDTKYPYPGHSLEFHNLVVLAKAKGLINKDLNTDIVAQKAIDFVANELKLEFHQLPTECFDDEFLDSIFQWTQKEEETLLPKFYQEQGGEQGLRDSFEIFKRDKSCSLKSSEICADEKWIKFFQSL